MGVTQAAVMKALDLLYDKAIDGFGAFDSAYELADEYMQGAGSLDEKIDSLIRMQATKSGILGFVTGLGGIITLPVAIPANLASVMLVQIRMIAAIAYMCGKDLKSDQVKTLVYACMVGDGAKDILKQAGIKVCQKLSQKAIQKIPAKVIIVINQKVGFRLVTKFGEKGVINISKAIPLIGGLVGGSMDAYWTRSVGRTTKEIFMDNSSFTWLRMIFPFLRGN